MKKFQNKPLNPDTGYPILSNTIQIRQLLFNDFSFFSGLFDEHFSIMVKYFGL